MSADARIVINIPRFQHPNSHYILIMTLHIDHLSVGGRSVLREDHIIDHIDRLFFEIHKVIAGPPSTSPSFG